MSIKCRECENEVSSKCNIKKTTVRPNKSRKCNYFVLDNSKVVAALERRATAMDNQDRALRTKVMQDTNSIENKHPSTGDLSRFSTTATKKESINEVSKRNHSTNSRKT